MLRFTALLILLLSLVPILMARPGSIKLTPGEQKDIIVGMPRFTKNGVGEHAIFTCGAFCFFIWAPVCTQLGEYFTNRCYMDHATCLDGVIRYVQYEGECRDGIL